MAGVWDRELQELLTAQRNRWKHLQKEVADARTLLEQSSKRLEWTQQKGQVLIDDFADKIARLMKMRNDPEVVIRNYQPTTIYTYHSDTACGWVRDPNRTTRILLSDAKERGYHPCTSCGYRVARRAA